MRSARFSLITGALFMGSGVVLGAWGAHGLETFLGHSNTSSWETGVLYQLMHGLSLLVVGVLLQQQFSQRLSWVSGLMIAGVLLFSGSLYALTLGGPRWLGPITPLGGACFIGAWCLMVVLLARSK
ncbi:MAG: DUF423 domain-containing protein [Pseudomonadales bacterium]|nr:DUF423 domain-containing protein [Pseudomonadales bacterium]